MKKILVLLGRYYPKASPNTICMQNILDSLPEDEYKIEIICYDDGEVTETTYPITKVSRGGIQKAIYALEGKTGPLSRCMTSLFGIAQKIKMLPFVLTWPWVDPVVTYKELKAAERIYNKEKFDTVIAVYMPLSSVIVGHRLKHNHPEISFIPYFLDSLSGGYIPHLMKKSTYERKAIKWEQKLLSNADKVVFMESSRDYHTKIYEDSAIATNIHYLDLPMLRKSSILCDNRSDEVTLVYVGSIALNIRSPEYFLKVISQIPNENWRLIFIGEANCDLLNEYAKKDPRVTVIGRCSHDQALEYESRATVLINLGNKNPNLTPSKIFEYMSWRKKIVSTYLFDNDTSISYLKKYPAALLLDERESDLSQSALRLQTFIKEKSDSISYDEIRERFWANTPEAFIELIQGGDVT